MKKLTGILLFLCLALSLSGCNSSDNHRNVENGKIAILSGTIYDVVAEQFYPDAEIEYYNTTPELVLAVKNGLADAFVYESIAFNDLAEKNPGLVEYGEALETLDYSFLFRKGDDSQIKADLDEFITKLISTGEMDNIVKTFSDQSTPVSALPEVTSNGSKGVVRVANTSDIYPFCYMKNGQMTGIDVAVLNLFANEYDYEVKIFDYDLSSLLESVSSGKCDFAGSGFNITEERAAVYDFTTPYIKGGIITVVFDNSVKVENPFTLSAIRNSIYNNFVVEGRWQMVLEGVLATILITLSSALVGTLAGFLIYILYKKSKLAGILLKIASWLVYGMPMVVLLMILYYMVFSKSGIPSAVIAAIGFSLTFAFSVFAMINKGVNAVDIGQSEAGYTLGYSRNATFFKWIFPQAVQNLMPDYKSELMSLIKSTSIVGYIGVMDLTKAVDIIRSRTYDAFFPLIATAMIYLALGSVLMFVIGKIADKFTPSKKNREKLLKGVKTK